MNDTSTWPEGLEVNAENCLVQAIVKSGEGELLSGLWYVGVIMSIVSSILSNLGVNVQKYSMMLEWKKVQEDPDHSMRPYIFQKVWLFGLVMVITGSIGDFAALGFAAQTLATPVGGFTMVANVFFAHFFLHERLGCRDLIATLLVILGVVGVAVSADKTEKKYTLDCLLVLYQRPVFIAYLIGFAFTVAILFFSTRYLNHLRKTEPDGTLYKRYKKLHPICPAALSGVIGAQTVLFAKCSAELIGTTINGDNQFSKWETYIILVCMLFCIFNQLHWLAVGLKDFEAVLIIPVFQCFFITGGVVGGGVFFNEFSNLAAWEKALFAAGVALTIFGVFLLAQREEAPENDTKVQPETTHGTSTIINSDGKSNQDDRDLESSIGANSSFERPPTPMPLSLQYHSLAMSDLYTALRDSLSTPERGTRRIQSANGQPRQRVSSLPNVDEARVIAMASESDLNAAGKETPARGKVKKKEGKKKKKKKSAEDVEQQPEGNPHVKQAW